MGGSIESDWFEVWCEGRGERQPPYVLLLVRRRADGDAFVVMDPRDDNRIVHSAPDYEAAKLWLLGDEFVLVRGRTFFGEL